MERGARGIRSTFLLLLGLLTLMPAGVAQHSQTLQHDQTLVLTGRSGEIPVARIGGRHFVEVEALTRLANGSLKFNGHQIVLTLPFSGGDAAASPAASHAPSGFSKDFVKAGIEQMAVIREWRSTLTTAVKGGYPINEHWTESFRARAQQSLLLATVTASTESDHKAVQLLTNEFNNMKALCDRFLETSKSHTYIPTTALDNDPLDQKILDCAHSLAAMAASNQFEDNGSCR